MNPEDTLKVWVARGGRCLDVCGGTPTKKLVSSQPPNEIARPASPASSAETGDQRPEKRRQKIHRYIPTVVDITRHILLLAERPYCISLAHARR
jgi:hypothetical protein